MLLYYFLSICNKFESNFLILFMSLKNYYVPFLMSFCLIFATYKFSKLLFEKQSLN